MIGDIICTGLDELRWACRQHCPARIVSIRSPGSPSWEDMALPSMSELVADRLDLTFHDVPPLPVRVEGSFASLQNPESGDVGRLIDFVHAWSSSSVRSRPMLMHCQLGISRSTASVLVALAALNPKVSEHKLAEELVSAAPAARPNLQVVALADAALNRGGRLLVAAREVYRPFNPALSAGTAVIPARL